MPELPDIDSGGRPTRKESKLREAFRILAQEKDAEIDRLTTENADLKKRLDYLVMCHAPALPDESEEE